MSFRTVVIRSKSKISYKNNYLVVKKETDESYVNIQEIDTIIVESLSVSITAYLLNELANHKINIIFCDEKNNPFGELVPFYASHNTSKKIKNQIAWTDKRKKLLWTEIIKNKLINQKNLLYSIDDDSYAVLENYVIDLKLNDSTNREGHGAKVYFNSLFGKKFIRHSNDDINVALNYGYSILLSTFNKEIISQGYLTQIGIHHKSEYNQFNLACDFMEPFRVIIDEYVLYNSKRDLEKNYKMELVNLLNNSYVYNGKKFILKDIIKLYTKICFDFLELNKEFTPFIYEK